MAEGVPQNRAPRMESGFAKGLRVTVRKRSIEIGKESAIRTGDTYAGKLLVPIQIGQPIALDSGLSTSHIRSLEQEGEVLVVRTDTSVYEVRKSFNGVRYHSEIGDIMLPQDARPAMLEPGSAPEFSIQNRSTSELVQVKIHRDALKGILIQTGGGAVHAIDERYFVLARVGNAHIPFYRSSSGTSGKRKGEWYPFFGHTGSWIIKGESIDKDGHMEYDPAVTKVQNILNEHLILPNPMFVDKEFKIVNREGTVLYELGKEIPMTDIRNTNLPGKFPMWDSAVAAYVEQLTGYVPTKLEGYHPTDTSLEKRKAALEWIDAAIKQVKA
jgi:hypothetical protein